MLRNLYITVIVLLLSIGTGAIATDLGFSRETPDQWRTSKLTGMSVLGPENQVDGTITDILIGENGQAEYVIIGVGGFFGIDRRDVAIPFAQVKFTKHSLLPPQNPAGFNNTSGAAGSSINGDITTSGAATLNSGMAMATSGVSSKDRTRNAETVRSAAYPDHGTIKLNLDQLERAPTFAFAR